MSLQIGSVGPSRASPLRNNVFEGRSSAVRHPELVEVKSGSKLSAMTRSQASFLGATLSQNQFFIISANFIDLLHLRI